MDKDIELQKIQALDGYFHTRINTAYSLAISFIVGFIIFLGTLYYQGVFTIIPETSTNFWIAIAARTVNILIFTLILVGAVYYLRSKMLKSTNDVNDRCLAIIEDLLGKVEKGETLPSLTELKKLADKKEPKTYGEERIETSKETKSQETKKLEEKIDSLLKDFEEAKQERKRERTLSKIDGLYNLLITLSTFTIAIIISQSKAILTNVLISLPMIGIVFSMIISFIIGVRGMLNNSMENRMLSYCLLLSLSMWYIAIPTLIIASDYLTTLELRILAGITTIALSGLTIIFSKFFIQRFEKKFHYLFEQETNVWKKIASKILLYVVVMVVLTIIVTLILFLALLPSLLNSPTL